jgi:hypothetical protein
VSSHLGGLRYLLLEKTYEEIQPFVHGVKDSSWLLEYVMGKRSVLRHVGLRDA